MAFDDHHSTDARFPVNPPERNDNALFNSTMTGTDSGIAIGTPGKNHDISKFGFPSIDMTGFGQEAPHKSEGIDKLLHGIKHLFVKDDTLDDQVRHKVESQMTPDEKKQYDTEQKAMDAYNRRLATESTLYSKFPDPPDCPMHAEVDQRVQAVEKNISAQVEQDMTPSERQRLHGQMSDYEKKCEDSRKDDNPLGTGGGMRPLPEPGNAVKDYFDRISEATERYLKN